ncbi:ROK family protein [Humibacter sp. BT305]|nr:ROK family protein [Humibacter sp. BT305]
MTKTPQLALAVDVGGTKVETALVRDDATLVEGTRHRRPTGAGSDADQLAASVADAIRATLAEAERAHGIAANDLVGAGVGSAGPIDLDRGAVSPINLHAWRGYPLADLVAETSGLQTTLRLDGTCILLAELWAGALQGRRNAMGMIVSTGIGGGLILEGKLIAGRTGNAGHIGQVQIRTHEQAGRDLSVTLEGVASGTATVAFARSLGWTGERGEDLARDYAEGDARAVAAVERCADAIGEAIASVCALVDLEAVAIGGGFSRVTPDLFELIRSRIDEVAPFPTICGVEVVPSALSDEGPLIGAAGLVHRADLLP